MAQFLLAASTAAMLPAFQDVRHTDSSHVQQSSRAALDAVASLIRVCAHLRALFRCPCSLVVQSARVQQLCSSLLSHSRPLDQVISLHLRSLVASASGDAAGAVQSSSQAADLMYTVMEHEKDSNWSLPLINVLFRQLRLCSYAADGELERRGEKTHHMVDTQDVLKRYLQKMVIDRAPAPVSKKAGCLFVIVHLFKLYFRLNHLKLCTFLVKMVAQLPDLRTYPKAQVVAYRYYLGRLHVFEEKYEEAEESLTYAFRHCAKAAPANKRRILHFLIPVKLLRGQYPHERLLQKYRLEEFSSLIRAIRGGDLSQFNATLMRHQRFFVAKGIYLMLEKLKIFVYRNLFRKWSQQQQQRNSEVLPAVPLLLDRPPHLLSFLFSLLLSPLFSFLFHSRSVSDPSTAHQLPLDTLLAALRLNGTEMSVDELECILANLIFQQNIKGYIAHKRCVVLSKADPFPKLS